MAAIQKVTVKGGTKYRVIIRLKGCPAQSATFARKTDARKWAQEASLLDIAAILGHKTLSMVKRYSYLSDTHISGVVGAMNDRIFK